MRFASYLRRLQAITVDRIRQDETLEWYTWVSPRHFIISVLRNPPDRIEINVNKIKFTFFLNM
jgi:hypothetical protein